jgi:hypothetical protein
MEVIRAAQRTQRWPTDEARDDTTIAAALHVEGLQDDIVAAALDLAQIVSPDTLGWCEQLITSPAFSSLRKG